VSYLHKAFGYLSSIVHWTVNIEQAICENVCNTSNGMSDKRVSTGRGSSQDAPAKKKRRTVEYSESDNEDYSDADSTASAESNDELDKERSSLRKGPPLCCRCRLAPSTVGCVHSEVRGRKLEVHLCLCKGCGDLFKEGNEGVCPVEGCEAPISDVATISGLCSGSSRGSALPEDAKAKGKNRGREGSCSDRGSTTTTTTTTTASGQSASTEVIESPSCSLCTYRAAKWAFMHSKVFGNERIAHLGVCSDCMPLQMHKWDGVCPWRVCIEVGKRVCGEKCSGVARIIGFEEWQVQPDAQAQTQAQTQDSHSGSVSDETQDSDSGSGSGSDETQDSDSGSDETQDSDSGSGSGSD
jgi:hypothetical protein